MIRDTRQQFPQVTFGIDAIQLSTADQTVDRRGTLSAAIGARKKAAGGVKEVFLLFSGSGTRVRRRQRKFTIPQAPQ
jgi:hypothetical protein